VDRFFSLFGKIILWAIALLLIIGAGYYIGTRKNAPPIKNPIPTPLPTKQPTPTPTIKPTQTASPSGVMESL
jgi:hypothetical protein